MSPRLHISESRIAVVGGILLAAMIIRVVCSFLVGAGSFGPDGTGAEAAVELGNHPNVLHPFLIDVFGGGRGLSALGGAVTAVACGKMGERLGGNLLACGFMGACAPLLVIPSSMAGGDAPAIALASSGVALAWWGHPLKGGVLAALSLGVKGIALPILILLPVSLIFVENKRRHAAQLAIAVLAVGIFFLSSLDPLLQPRPHSGILGSWWLATDGVPPTPGQWWSLGWVGFKEISTMPTWTGHPVLGLLALWGCIRAKNKALWWVLGLSGFALLCTAAPLGSQLRVRYLAPASIGITVLAGCAIGRAYWAPFLFLWPCLAFTSQLGALRSHEDGIGPRPRIPFLQDIDVEPTFEEGGICGGNELRNMARALAKSLPKNTEVAAIRLRDGREMELFWRLKIRRRDLNLVHLGADCCPTGDYADCAQAARTHIYKKGGALVIPGIPPKCKTHLASPKDMDFAQAFGLVPKEGDRFHLYVAPGNGRAQQGMDACRQSLASTGHPVNQRPTP